MYEESHALLIGEVNYTNGWPSLKEIPEEIRELSSVLERHRFKVEVHFDLQINDFIAVIDEFMRRYATRENARILVYLAGHGFSRNSFRPPIGYFLPVDAAKASDPAEVAKTSIQLDLFRYWAEIPDAKHVLFVFDACFSGAFFGYQSDGRPRRRIQNSTLASLTPPEAFGIEVDNYAISSRPMSKGRQFISAGGSDEVVPSKSILSRLLSRMLSDQVKDVQSGFDRWVTAQDIGLWLQRNAGKYTPSEGSAIVPDPLYGTLPNSSNFQYGNMVFDRLAFIEVAEPAAPLFPIEMVIAQKEYENFMWSMYSAPASHNASQEIRDSRIEHLRQKFDDTLNNARLKAEISAKAANAAVTPQDFILSEEENNIFIGLTRELSSGNIRERREARKELGRVLSELQEGKRLFVTEKLVRNLSVKSFRYQIGVAEAIALQERPMVFSDAATVKNELTEALRASNSSKDTSLANMLKRALLKIG